MEPLSFTEQHALLQFLEAIYASQDVRAFIQSLVEGLPAVIPADLASWHEVDPRTRRTITAVTHPRPPCSYNVSVFDGHLEEHPLYAHWRLNPDPGALKIRDVLPARAYHRTVLYNELYRPAGLEYDLSTPFMTSPGTLAVLTLRRRLRDFSEHERGLFNLLRPHISQALRNARLCGAACRVLASAGQDWETQDGVVQEGRPMDGGAWRAFGISARKAEVFVWVAQGKTNKEIARELHLSARTVAKHLEDIFRKLGVHRRAEAAACFFRVVQGKS